MYSDDEGRLVGERSAVLLVYRSAHLERVYADAQSGDRRAQALVRQLEATFHVDQMAVDEATLGPGQKPVVHSFSTKQHDFAAKTPKEALAQIGLDVREARTKYAGTVEIRRPGHPLFGRKVVVSRVHLIYDGKDLSPEVRKALLSEARDRGVELHFHVP